MHIVFVKDYDGAVHHLLLQGLVFLFRFLQFLDESGNGKKSGKGCRSCQTSGIGVALIMIAQDDTTYAIVVAYLENLVLILGIKIGKDHGVEPTLCGVGRGVGIRTIILPFWAGSMLAELLVGAFACK